MTMDRMPTTAPYTTTSESSKKAAEAVGQRLPNQRTRIYQYLLNHPSGATYERMMNDLNMHHSSVSTRLGELELVGYVRRTGTFGPTLSGNDAEIYVAVPRDDPHPPKMATKATLRQAAKAVVKATDEKDATALREAIGKLREVLING
jgi:predicted transcriptional regulator